MMDHSKMPIMEKSKMAATKIMIFMKFDIYSHIFCAIPHLSFHKWHYFYKGTSRNCINGAIKEYLIFCVLFSQF